MANARKTIPSSRRFFSQRNKLAFLLAIISIALYANTLKNEYAYDDNVVIGRNALVKKGISAIPELLSTPYLQGIDQLRKNNLYRPLTTTMYAIEYQVFDNSPFADHLINILLFCGCVILLFFFLEKLFAKQNIEPIFIACLFFALHPIHTEVVANIKSQDELFCFFFVFLSLNAFIDYARSGKLYLLFAGGACYFLSALFKETSITMMAVIPVAFFFYKNEFRKRSLLIIVCAAAAMLIYLAIRTWVLSNYEFHVSEVSILDNQLADPPSYISRLATAIVVLGDYLRLLFVPYPLYCDYSYNAVPFAHPGDPGVIVSLAIYLGLIFICIYRLVKFRGDPMAFGILFFMATISLFSNLFFLVGAMKAERFLFFPSVGFCIAIAFALHRWLGDTGSRLLIFKNSRAWILLFPFFLIFAWLTINRNSDWKDNRTLYEADSKKSSNSWRIYYSLGTELCQNIVHSRPGTSVNTPEIEEGVENLEKAVAIVPGYDVAQEHLGTAFFALQKYDSAEVHLKKALDINPRNKEAISSITNVYFYGGRFENALRMYQYGLSIDPAVRGWVYGKIGVCYLELGKYDSAVVALRRVLSQEPYNATINKLMASAFAKMGVTDSAEKYSAIATAQQ